MTQSGFVEVGFFYRIFNDSINSIPWIQKSTVSKPTAAYRFKNCDHAARLFELSEGGNIYTRLQNPTTTAYEQRIAALYGAVGALAVSSGMSAILIAVLSLAARTTSSARRCEGSASTAASLRASVPRISRR